MAKATGDRPDIPARRKDAGRGGVRPPAGSGNAGRRAAQQQSKRRRRLLTVGVPVAVVVVVAVIVAVIVSGGGGSSGPSAVGWATPSGAKVYGAKGPEGIPLELGPPLAPANQGLTGVVTDGVQCNSSEQLVYHHHVHVAIFVNGQPRSIPYGVGMVPPVQVSKTPSGNFADGSSTCLYWLHVHAQDGVVHIESPQSANYVLAQAFGVWRQPLSSTRLGPDTGKVTAFVDGKRWTGDPGQIKLAEHAQIVLDLGTPIVQPPPVDWSGTKL